MIDAEVAQELASQVREAAVADKRRSWRKATTVMSAFDVYRLTDASRGRIDTALTQAGLVCDPTFHEVQRAGSVRLSLRDIPEAVAPPVGGLDRPGVTRWVVAPGRLEPLRAGVGTDDTLLVDVDLSLASAQGLRELLLQQLSGINKETVDDLLDEDREAAFKVPQTDSPRRASVFQVSSPPLRTDDEHSAAIAFSARLIELAVGPKWVLTVRHPPQAHKNGAPTDLGGQAETPAGFTAPLGYAIRRDTSPEQLAGSVIRQAVLSFGTVRNEMASYQETWVIEEGKGHNQGAEVLQNLQGMIPVLAERLRPLQHPSVTMWLGVSGQGVAPAIEELVSRELERLSSLGKAVATNLVVVQQRVTERYQRALATVAAVLLAPALVASVFGASDELSDSWTDLLVLLVLMALTVVVSLLGIWRYLRPVATTSRTAS